MHRLLKRQLKRLRKAFPEGDIPLEKLLEVVDATYQEADRERNLKDRSVKLMSAELLAANQRLRQEHEDYIDMILHQVVDGVCTFDRQHKIRSFNPAMEQLFACHEAEMIGEKIDHLIFNEEKEEQENLIQLYETHFASDELSSSLETVGVRRLGERFPIELSLSCMKGEEEVYIAIIRDISSRKEAEQILIEAKDKAEEISQAKSNFLSVMSHEIRTPMNAVLGITNLLLEEGPRQDQLESLRSLKFSGEQLLVLINDVLDFSKIEAGKIVFEKIAFDMIEVVQNIKRALQIKAEEKGIALRTHFDPQISRSLIGDPARLGQVLNNLIGNAIKFTHEGFVEIRLKKVKSKQGEEAILFEIEDSGIGISPDKQKAVFESFTQSNSSITRKYGGTGLGLAITKRLLHLQQSEIKLRSQVGVGTCFYFTQVFVQPKESLKVAGAQILPTQSSVQQFDGQAVLLVEDNRVNQMVATRYLRKWGLTVSVANDGQEAIDLAAKQDFALVLMDLQMPNVDGYTASRRIRQLGKVQSDKLPIIALTASVNGTVKQEIFDAGMDNIVSKPFQPAKLNLVIAHHLERGRARWSPIPKAQS